MSKRTVRDSGTDLSITNSGLEVWLYDDQNREDIRNAGTPDEGFGGMPPRFEESTAKGLIVGYSLVQDDDVQVTVFVGDPLTDAELAVGHWLEPQTAFLQLPSGKLCVESNDANRIGPEPGSEQGGVVTVPPGDYRLTLYRVDHEALDREGMEWEGSQELVVLTPGGSPADAADGLLPFQERRDLNWVGKYSIRGKQADALIWFGDRWDTFLLNLDGAAVAKLGLTPGSYLETRIPDAGLTLVSTFADSWSDAKKLPTPEGINEDEYGFAALNRMQDWNFAEALYCRRDTSKTKIEDRHVNIWLSAIVEVLDAKPKAVESIRRTFTPSELRRKQYYSPTFLGLILGEVLPGVGDLDELLLPEAVERMDAAFDAIGLAQLEDITWAELYDRRAAETTARLYVGPSDSFGVLLCSEQNIAVFFLSEREDGKWILTGCADDVERWIRLASERQPEGLRVECNNMDEDLEAIHEAHREAIEKSDAPIAGVSTDRAVIDSAFSRFLTAAFG